MRMPVAAFWLLLGACLRASEPAPDPTQEHRDKVQGVWTALELDGAGQNVPTDAKPFRLLFKEDMVVFDRGDEKTGYRFRLRRPQSSQQGEIDLIPAGEKDGGPTWRGIYFLSNAHFKLCFCRSDPQKRPPEFSAKIDVGLWVIECSCPNP
jgi:uncharacterized protein (TIGR03067 family)